jgi:hypothetical protein
MADVREVQGADHHHQPGRARGRQCGGAQLWRRRAARHHQQQVRHKAIEKGADGLIAVATGAGGHAGVKSPFALIQEIRQWFDGPLALSGSIATGGAGAGRAGHGRGLCLHRLGLHRHRGGARHDAYKQAIVDGTPTTSSTATCSPACMATTWRPHPRAGLDPEQPARVSDPSKMNFGGAQAQGLEGHLGLRPGHRVSGAGRARHGSRTRERGYPVLPYCQIETGEAPLFPSRRCSILSLSLSKR